MPNLIRKCRAIPLLIMLFSCQPEDAYLYIVNRFDKEIVLTLEYPNPDPEAIGRIERILEKASIVSSTDIQRHQARNPVFAPLHRLEKPGKSYIRIPPSSYVVFGVLGSRAYSLDPKCRDAGAKAGFPRRMECDSIIYFLSSLTAETPHGSITLTGFQIARAFRRISAVQYVLEFAPDFPESEEQWPRRCLF